jgi:hypothetical protein
VSVVVESADLYRIVSPWLINQDESDDATDTPLMRTIARLEAVSESINTPDGARRFLWNLKRGSTITTTSRRAEELLIAVEEVGGLHNLVHLFTTLQDARAAADAHYADKDADPIEIRELARALYGFSRGYLTVLGDGLPQSRREERDRNNALRRERMRAQREAVAA